MDFRLPGSVSLEMLEFTPQAGGEPVTGAVVGTTDIAEGGQEGSQTEEAAVEDPGQNPAPPNDAAAERWRKRHGDGHGIREVTRRSSSPQSSSITLPQLPLSPGSGTG